MVNELEALLAAALEDDTAAAVFVDRLIEYWDETVARLDPDSDDEFIMWVGRCELSVSAPCTTLGYPQSCRIMGRRGRLSMPPYFIYLPAHPDAWKEGDRQTLLRYIDAMGARRREFEFNK